MLYGNPRLYEETCELKRGTRRLSPCMDNVRKRIADRFGINVVNVYYDTLESGAAKGRPRLNFIVEFWEEVLKLRNPWFAPMKPEVERGIVEDFASVVRQMGVAEEFKVDRMFVTLDAFAKEAMHQAVAPLFRTAGEQLVARFAGDGLWRITGISKRVVVFFVDEEAKKRALGDGAAGCVREACFEVAKRGDEFGYLTAANFDLVYDTKEHLDREYEGNLFYYFR